MAGSVRQKVDPRIRDMFDQEVDRPDHDQILTGLFKNAKALQELVTRIHGVGELRPFSPEVNFTINPYGIDTQVVSYDEAVRLTKIVPRWASSSAARVVAKQMEVPLYSYSENGRSSRIMGFADIVVGYEVLLWPTIHRNADGEFSWQKERQQFHLLIEVKGAWPTAGNLIRQLNLYRSLVAGGFHGSAKYLVVGPDDSMAELADHHGYSLAVVSDAEKGPELIERPKRVQPNSLPGTF